MRREGKPHLTVGNTSSVQARSENAHRQGVVFTTTTRRSSDCNGRRTAYSPLQLWPGTKCKKMRRASSLQAGAQTLRCTAEQ